MKYNKEKRFLKKFLRIFTVLIKSVSVQLDLSGDVYDKSVILLSH